MNTTQLDLFPETLAIKIVDNDERIRLSIGRFATIDQLHKELVARKALGQEIDRRREIATWEIIRLLYEKNIKLEEILKQNNITF